MDGTQVAPTGAGASTLIRRLGEPGDLGWIIMAHGEVYPKEYGWDTTVEAFTGRIVLDWAERHDPRREAGWIAEADGRRAGCVLCVADDESTARLRVLLVHPRARGLGLGGRLVDACVDFAREKGYARLRLWTNDPLVAARQVYRSRGFTLVCEQPHHSFGVDLVGQTYELTLRQGSAPR
jgi:GNAT superfamily N-acetyltransferase